MTLRILAAGLLLAALFPTASRAADPAPAYKPKINEIVTETQKSSPSTDTIDLVWWIPAEFWLAAAEKDLPDAARKELSQLFRENTVVGAVVGDKGSLGLPKFRSEADIRAQIRLLDASGHAYPPLDPAKVDKDLATMLQMLKPMLASVIGEMGDNLNFYVFPARDKGGKRIADPAVAGKLTVKIADTAYAFRLPLGSLLPPRFDATTGEEFPGSYRFNPYTGAELKASAGAAR